MFSRFRTSSKASTFENMVLQVVAPSHGAVVLSLLELGTVPGRGSKCRTLLQKSVDAAVPCVTRRVSSKGLNVIHIHERPAKELLEAEHPGRKVGGRKRGDSAFAGSARHF